MTKPAQTTCSLNETMVRIDPKAVPRDVRTDEGHRVATTEDLTSTLSPGMVQVTHLETEDNMTVFTLWYDSM